jgi:hypothetical protein
MRELAQVEMTQQETYERADLREQLGVAFLPSTVFIFQSHNVFISCVQFSLHGSGALTQWIELVENSLQLGVKLTRAFRMCFGVCAKRSVALAQEVQLLDFLDQFRVLCVGCGRRSSTFSFLEKPLITGGQMWWNRQAYIRKSSPRVLQVMSQVSDLGL